MSISSALSNALSGLTATSRGTEIVSSNLANMNTPGYGVRELALTPRTYIGNSGGVHISGVTRFVPAAILADSRISQADLGKSEQIFNFHSRMEAVMGLSDTTESLTSILAEFDATLAHAAGNPSSEVRLQSTVEAALSLTDKINQIAAEIQNARSEADRAIASDVDRLNTAISEVARLNRSVTAAQSLGKDTASLLDARQRIIDEISDIVPLQEVPRSGGQIALFTKGGAVLLDGSKPVEISFSSVGIVTPYMSIEQGHLGTLQLGTVALSPNQHALIQGGRLEASFKVRDKLAPEYQKNLDAYALDLSARISGPIIDPTVSDTDAGLFTDLQSLVRPEFETGLANRLQVNNLVNSEFEGAPFRIRDGLGATISGDVGSGTILNRIRDSLNIRPPSHFPGHTYYQSSFDFASILESSTATSRISSENTFQRQSSYANSLTASLLTYGVNSDNEMSNLLQLERAFSANAKVIQTAIDMLDNILRL